MQQLQLLVETQHLPLPDSELHPLPCVPFVPGSPLKQERAWAGVKGNHDNNIIHIMVMTQLAFILVYHVGHTLGTKGPH